MDYRIAPIHQEELVKLRRELHMYPELGWDLDRTAALVRRELDSAGIPYEAGRYGRNTVVATINPDCSGFTIGLRADMDALPIHENNLDKPYRSRRDGIMHACGHDAHTAMMIGTAKALFAIRDRLKCRVRILFQPCEESRPSGARTMCEHGVMKDIDCIVMCHVNCVDPVHVISSNPGVTNSSSVAFTVTLGGKAVHVAVPHQGIDALAAGVKLYSSIQMLVSREVDPFDTCVMSVTCLQAGETTAANADRCVLKGSIRCVKDETMVWARKRLEELVRSTAEQSRTTWSLEWSGDPLPSAHNDPALYEAFVPSARKVVGAGRVIVLPPSPGGEDFAYYEKEKPGLLFGLGMRNEARGCVHPAHTKDWDIDEDGLETGVKVFVQFVLDHMDGISGIRGSAPAAVRKPVFYCQLDYEQVPYPSPDNPEGNLATSGCGICSTCMVAENMLNISFPPEEGARLAKSCGAREGYGTDLYIYAPVFAERVGLRFRHTEDGQEALRFLQEGRGMVIANTYGDRPGHTGVFSDSGHYIVLASANGTEVRVWDPMYREGGGRYDRPGRAGKVRLDGTDAYADFSVIEKDCYQRPYFLFWKE